MGRPGSSGLPGSAGGSDVDRGLLFDEAPTLYDRFRPASQAEVIAALHELAGLGRGSRVVEVGPGTGRLTGPLLRHRVSVTAIEPGERMAAFLASKFGEESGLAIIRSRFEDADLPVAAFDAVAAATAFHWIDPQRRYQSASRVLLPRGRLVLVASDRVISSTNEQYHRGGAPISSGLRPRSDRPMCRLQRTRSTRSPTRHPRQSFSKKSPCAGSCRTTHSRPTRLSGCFARTRTIARCHLGAERHSSGRFGSSFRRSSAVTSWSAS